MGDLATAGADPEVGVEGDADACGAARGASSDIIGGSLMFILWRSAGAGAGRASDAVDEIIGVARDEDTTAGTEADLTIRARLAGIPPPEVDAASTAGGVGVTEGEEAAVLAKGLSARGRESTCGAGDLDGSDFGVAEPAVAVHCSMSLVGFR